MIVVDSCMVSITSFLLAELIKRKIKILFCDEKRNPISELMPLYGSHNTSKKILGQIKWQEEIKGLVWKSIIENKILNQATLLQKHDNDERAEMLLKYSHEVDINDITNREGHAAKVYFNSLFGPEFTRHGNCPINASLDYGYAILLSSINKEIVSKGYLTQLGIKHKNEFNRFNLSYDLMEPFRVLIDAIVMENVSNDFNADYKHKLIEVHNKKVKIVGKSYYFANALSIYINEIFKALDEEKPNLVPIAEFNEL